MTEAEGQGRKILEAFVAVLTAAVVLVMGTAAQARRPDPAVALPSGWTATVSNDRGQTVVVQGPGDVQCVDDGKLSCTVRGGGPPDVAITTGAENTAVTSGSTSGTAILGATATVFNMGSMTSTFNIDFTAPVSLTGSTHLGASIAGSTTDANLDGTGGIGTDGSLPLYVALIDSMPVLGTELHPAPFAVPGPSVPGSFGFAGQTQSVAAASFGLPGLTQGGPAVMSTIGFRLHFQLSGGDSAGFVGLLAATTAANASQSGTATAVLGPNQLGCSESEGGLDCAAASPQVLQPGVRIDNLQVSAQAATTCHAVVHSEIGVMNVTSIPQSFLVTVTLPVTLTTPGSVIGGSMGGAVVDGNLDGVGGLGTVAPNALYTATIDGSPVQTLDNDPFAVPGPTFPGTFTFAGASATIPPQSFGLPGPSLAGPTVTSSIGLQYSFKLAPLDSAELTGIFVADCVPSPTSTPSDTPTQTSTPTASATATATATASNTATATVTATATNTATATATRTPQPNGAGCTSGGQCASTFCANGICCDSACTDPLMRCNLPGQVGTCASAAAAAPTLTPWGLLVAAILLTGVAAFALRYRMRGR